MEKLANWEIELLAMPTEPIFAEVLREIGMPVSSTFVFRG